jgi:hypothetical protein
MPRGYEHFNDEIRNLPGRTADAGKSKAPLCEGCACNSICTGVWSAQLEMHGEGELQPFAAMPAARPSTRR